MPPFAVPQKEWEKVCTMYLAHNGINFVYKVPEIADEFNASINTIKRIIKKCGYKLRKHGGNKPIKNLPPKNERPPLCKCGCGKEVSWNRAYTGGKWNAYHKGHYQQKRQYHNKEWIYNEYHIKLRTLQEIADQFDVGPTAIRDAMKKLKIPTRTTQQSLLLRKSVAGNKNPAWKGGIANWDYCSDWKSRSKAIKDRDQWTCQLCKDCRKRWNHNLHVHHIDEDKTNNHPTNLISLCDQCHKPIHGNKNIQNQLSKIAIHNTHNSPIDFSPYY
ncbi:MAG: hypothetical protein H8D67_09870 [Deltaproteobacteria bacterium]|nr:hypothetical protein [Deltaproteobacteria bacterium]